MGWRRTALQSFDFMAIAQLLRSDAPKMTRQLARMRSVARLGRHISQDDVVEDDDGDASQLGAALTARLAWHLQVSTLPGEGRLGKRRGDWEWGRKGDWESSGCAGVGGGGQRRRTGRMSRGRDGESSCSRVQGCKGPDTDCQPVDCQPVAHTAMCLQEVCHQAFSMVDVKPSPQFTRRIAVRLGLPSSANSEGHR